MGHTRRRMLFAALLCSLLAVLALMPAAASATVVQTGPATFSSATPADGSATAMLRPPIAVEVFDPAGIRDAPWYKMKVDGSYVTPSIAYTVPGSTTRARITFNRKTDFAVGTHTVWVQVLNGESKISTYQWNFQIVSEPKFGVVSPVAGSTTATLTPAVTAKLVSGAVAPISARAWIDGAETTATYNPANLLVSASLPGPLTNDRSYDVTVTVTNGQGRTATVSWSFDVQIFAAMEIAPCELCHASTIAAHPTDDCDPCHGEGSPVGGGYTNPWDSVHSNEGCDSCHPVSLDDCDRCHNGTYPMIPWHEPGAESAHIEEDSCAPCHVRSLTIEHNRREAGCYTCHTSSDAAVQQAIEADSTACESCHGEADHESLHALQRDDACALCHDGDSLTAVHMGQGGLTCDGCHESSDPEVVGAISQHLRECNACHTAEGTDYHLNMDAHYAPDSFETCGHCHHGWGSSPLRGPDVRRHAGGCATCHQDGSDLEMTTKCTNCHTTEETDYHFDTAVRHTPQDPGSLGCARCHETTDVRVLHETPGCETCHATKTCTECHRMHNPQPGTPLLSGLSCSAVCHTTEGTDYHVDFQAKHTSSANADCAGADCHAGDLVDVHSAYVAANPQFADECEVCHLNPDESRIPAGATAACGSCHDADHADLRETHQSQVVSGPVRVFNYHEGWSDVVWELDCGLCHESTNLLDTHPAGCSTCHSTPRNTFTTWNKTCQQGGCHVTFHDDAVPAHEAEYYSSDCETNCHNYDWSVPLENCGLCHSFVDRQPPKTTSNAVASYVGSAVVRLTVTDPYPSDGLGRTYYRIDGGPQAEGTTVVVPAPATGSAVHTIEFWSVDTKGNVEATPGRTTFTVSADAIPPVTTSNAKASYSGPATVKFTATDNGTSGVRATYYTVDGGAPTTGTVAVVPQPASGVATHTVTFWSVDWSGNVETAHTVSFTSAVDSVPPTTTLSGFQPWFKATRPPIDLVAVDGGDSGVAASYARVDGGTLLGGPSTGVLRITPYVINGMHTITWWSVDAVGNIENVNTATFGVDTVRPVTTAAVQSNYYEPAVITITPTDSLSGVKTTYYQVDGGSAKTGTQVTVAQPSYGSAYHTLTVWSEDNAGNVESKRTYSFYIHALTDTTAPTGTMAVNNGAAYTNTTAATVHSAMSDSGSGMWQMRIDHGIGIFGATLPYSATSPINLPAGDGVKTVRAEYFDRAGNVAAREDTITLDTTAPSGTMSINGGAATTVSTAATVDSAMSDATSGMDQMRVDPGTGVYGQWVAYSPQTAVTLTPGVGLKTVRVQYKDAAGNVIERADSIQLVTSTGEDTSPPLTTSDAHAAYSGTATIVLTAADFGGAGVKATYYRLDGGAQTTGTVVTVAAPASGSTEHTLEFWSEDNAGNVESPHGVVQFTVYSSSGQTGTIIFRWDYPPPDAWADFYVDGVLVASRSKDEDPGWDGWYVLTVPVRAQAYQLSSEWWDSYNWDWPEWSYGSALIDTPGKTVTWWY